MGTCNGKVKWYDIKNGYGFLTDENGQDAFVHYSAIQQGRHYIGLETGDEVTYGIVENEKGYQATNVILTKTAIRPKRRPKTTEDTEVPAEE